MIRPARLLTSIVDGYGVAGPTVMVIGAGLLKDCARVALAVTTKAAVAVFAPSFTVTVTVEVPTNPPAAVTVTVRFEPLPSRTMLPGGTRLGFEESTVTSRLAGGVSISVMVNPNGIVVAPIPIVWSGMLEMDGGSFTGFTVTRKFMLVVSWPSLTFTLIVAVPLWFAAGATDTVRFAPDPPKVILPVGTRTGFEEPLLKLRPPAAVSRSPTVKFKGPVLVSSLIAWSAMVEMVGGVLPGAFTVSTKVSLALAEPSVTVTVIVAVPVWPLPGVTVTVRLGPLPPNTIFPFGTRAVFDELPLTVRLAAAVSASPMVNGMAAVGVPVFTV